MKLFKDSKLTSGNSNEIIWKPHKGSQSLFLACNIFEVLLDGTRGSGKTDCLLVDFLRDVGVGHGNYWRGILFRQTYKQLNDVVEKTKRLFSRLRNAPKYNKADMVWEFPTGEQLLLRYMFYEADYYNYHGWEIPWIAWEELSNWSGSSLYHEMKSCCRTSKIGVPRRYRATCNSYGPGHGWIKRYFVDPAPEGVIITNDFGEKRVRIHSTVWENKTLLKADPKYVTRLLAIPNKAKRKAWAEGAWDIAVGGPLSDYWEYETHVIKPFPIPTTWRVDRSFDWGSSKPFAVLYWAECDGSSVVNQDGKEFNFKKGTLILIDEVYGCDKEKPDTGLRMSTTEICNMISNREMRFPFRVNPGPADNSIFDKDRGNSIANDMAKAGIRWTRSNKRPGSRVQGVQVFKNLLLASKKVPMEDKGFFIFDSCNNFLRTVPMLPADPLNPDDVDSDSEDHCWDAARYRILSGKKGSTRVQEV